MNNKVLYKKYNHYHLVEPSWLPLILAISLYLILASIVYGVFPVKSYGYHSRDFYDNALCAGEILFVLSMTTWFSCMRLEASLYGKHNARVRKGIMMGMQLFILSEVLFFLAFFWAFFYSAYNPSVDGTGFVWPAFGIEPMSGWGIPLLETVILVASAFTADWSKEYLRLRKLVEAIDWLWITIILGLSFLMIQAEEYMYYRYTINDGICNSTFFMATGFHGFHVIIGILILFFSLYRMYLGDFTPRKYLGFRCAIWYWHFVDVVWIFLYVSIYVWGGMTVSKG